MSAFPISAPDPVFNCPSCSHYLPPGSLACPECNTLIYTRHLNSIGSSAQSLEAANRWPEARDTWHSMLSWLPTDAPQHTAVRERIAQIEARLRTGEEKKAKWTKRLGPLAPAALFLAKFKSAFFLIFKLKFLLSFFAFFGLYWAMFGWKFALGFTVSILIHEMGHYVVVRSKGFKAELPFFLPGLGAYVRWYHQGVSLASLAQIALAGPFFGLLSALGFMGLYFATHQPVFFALTYAASWLNLMNLIPVFGLDGAQATYALNRIQRAMLLVVTVVLFAMMREWVFLFIGAGLTWRLFTKDAPEQPHTPTFIYFFLLLLSLGALVFLTPAGRF